MEPIGGLKDEEANECFVTSYTCGMKCLVTTPTVDRHEERVSQELCELDVPLGSCGLHEPPLREILQCHPAGRHRVV